MNTLKVFCFVFASTLLVLSVGQAREAVGPAKTRGDYRTFSESQKPETHRVRRSQPSYRYSAPQAVPMTADSQVTQNVPAQEAEERRFSQAPAGDTEAASTSSNNPCQPSTATAAPSNSGRRYSYAPAPQYSGNTFRRYDGNSRRSSQPTWSLQKTAQGKYNSL